MEGRRSRRRPIPLAVPSEESPRRSPALILDPASCRLLQGSREAELPREVREVGLALALFFLVSLPVLLGYRIGVTARRGWAWVAASRRRAAVARAISVALALQALLAGALVHHVYLNRADLPDPEPFIRFQPPTIGEVYDARGEVVIELAREYRRVVRYSELPLVVRQALVAAEDKNFFEHAGVDFSVFPRVFLKALLHSLSASVRSTRERGLPSLQVVLPQGGSTITQQLVRLYFLPEMTQREKAGTLMSDALGPRLLGALLGVHNANKLIRKLEEVRLALWLEHDLEWRLGSKQRVKQEILARYASFAYLGNGRYGLAAASEYYFDRRLQQLTTRDADKAALLAGITKSPADYAPSESNLERPTKRRNDVLARMAALGHLAPERARELQRRPIALAAKDGIKTIAPAAVASVFDELRRQESGRISVARLVEGRIRVHSTISARLQQIANQAVENGLSAYEERHPDGRGLVQASVVVLGNRDARILAEVGGRSVYQSRGVRYSDMNRATSSWRQPGSALKPIVYLAAFRQGSSLNSSVPDAPIRVSMGWHRPGKWISNYDGRFKGPIPIRQALAESRNAATMWVARQVGIEEVLQTARLLGIQTPLERYVTTALGASEVNLLELANAYRAMASGLQAEPFVIESVSDAGGATLYRHSGGPLPLPIEPRVLRQLQEGLRGVVRLPGGTAHSLETTGFPIPVMGKTGTTSDFRDALFVGSTYGPEGITVAVRVGYDDNRPLGEKETGGRTALPIFKEILQRAYAEDVLGPVPQFPPPIEEGIDSYLGRCREAAAEALAPPPDPPPADHAGSS